MSSWVRSSLSHELTCSFLGSNPPHEAFVKRAKADRQNSLTRAELFAEEDLADRECAAGPRRAQLDRNLPSPARTQVFQQTDSEEEEASTPFSDRLPGCKLLVDLSLHTDRLRKRGFNGELCWTKDRAPAICCFLHPGIFNKDATVAAKLVGVVNLNLSPHNQDAEPGRVIFF